MYGRGEKQVKRVKVEDTKGEVLRYREATKEATGSRTLIFSSSPLSKPDSPPCRTDSRRSEISGKEGAAIFEIHQMMLEDGDYQESIENIIHTQTVNAEYAVSATMITGSLTLTLSAVSP